LVSRWIERSIKAKPQTSEDEDEELLIKVKYMRLPCIIKLMDWFIQWAGVAIVAAGSDTVS
jgi:hypothetical protein